MFTKDIPIRSIVAVNSATIVDWTKCFQGVRLFGSRGVFSRAESDVLCIAESLSREMLRRKLPQY